MAHSLSLCAMKGSSSIVCSTCPDATPTSEKYPRLPNRDVTLRSVGYLPLLERHVVVGVLGLIFSPRQGLEAKNSEGTGQSCDRMQYLSCASDSFVAGGRPAHVGNMYTHGAATITSTNAQTSV